MAQPNWTTPAGSLGTVPAGLYTEIQLQANPVLPATSIVYSLLSGSLPEGFIINSSGKIYGTKLLVTSDTVYNFAVRITDNLGNIRDRTFSITIVGSAIPSFITPPGNILSVNDSIWVELPISYANPDITNEISIRVQEGLLPPGLEISSDGLIRGYAEPPILNVTVPSVVTTALATDSSNVITCLSTSNFSIGRQIVFTGSVFGNIVDSTTYYIKSIINGTSFTISATQDGPEFILISGTGFMTVTLPATSIGQPTIRTYTFGLVLESALGDDIASYSITVINQNTPISQGGPGFPSNTRIPTIYNTRPPSYDLSLDPYYGYYVLPDNDISAVTYPPPTPAFIGTFQSGDYFSFKLIGHDFDSDELTYVFADLPPGMIGDTSTGWISGIPIIATEGINQFGFSVSAYKTINPSIATPFFNFSYNLANNFDDTIVWITPQNLGNIFNGTISTKNVRAESTTDLEYEIISGSLPPNLTLLANGEITGFVAFEPKNTLQQPDSVNEFNFTVRAFSPTYPIVQSSKNFTISVVQEFSPPTDILYIKATPSIEDRILLDSLLNNETIIPTSMLYRPYDPYFGKSSSVIYEHAFGIYASDLNEYLAAVTQNHYWRYLVLGELKTAVARNDAGEIIYEVVYSEVIDNLVNPQGQSLPQSIYWPRPINLNLGPWYTSVTNVFTSYANAVNQNYYTSLTPGAVRTLYPNSLVNMRNRVGQVLGQNLDNKLLPLWMTSKQLNGGTLGFTKAWVICYTKPGMSNTIKNNINTLWVDDEGNTNTLNLINFQIDRFSVNKSLTYNYDKNTDPAAWTGLPSGTPVPDPLDSKDFYVLFPRKTILPNQV